MGYTYFRSSVGNVVVNGESPGVGAEEAEGRTNGPLAGQMMVGSWVAGGSGVEEVPGEDSTETSLTGSDLRSSQRSTVCFPSSADGWESVHPTNAQSRGWPR